MSLAKARVAPNLYGRDFFRWTVEQAAALREAAWDDVDWDNLADEVESLGRRDRRALVSHLEIVLAHLLKCIVQPERRTRSWDNTIRAHRDHIAKIVARNPSLRSVPAEEFEEAYRGAIFLAHRDTGLEETVFPVEPPFTLEQALRPDFPPSR